MGEDGRHGVVNHLGKVFRNDTQAVHDGLYVADGSMIRSALEVNPFLTISALTERIVEDIDLEADAHANEGLRAL
jgi:cholesterol oxidase